MPSWKAILFRHLLVWTYKPFQRTPTSFHAHIEKKRKAKTWHPSAKVRAQLSIEETESGGCRVFHATPNDDAPIEAHVLYIHGGSFIFESQPAALGLHRDSDHEAPRPRRRSAVSARAGAQARGHPLYDEMAAVKNSSTPFWCMGDSAGGTFTLGLTQRALDVGKPVADRLVPISPCVDATMANPDLFVVGIEKDPMLPLAGVAISRALFLGDLKPDDPLIITINGTVKGLPPMFVPLGTDDLLSPDAQLFVQKAKDNGCDVTSILGEGLFHVWFIFPI